MLCESTNTVPVSMTLEGMQLQKKMVNPKQKKIQTNNSLMWNVLEFSYEMETLCEFFLLFYERIQKELHRNWIIKHKERTHQYKVPFIVRLYYFIIIACSIWMEVVALFAIFFLFKSKNLKRLIFNRQIPRHLIRVT